MENRNTVLPTNEVIDELAKDVEQHSVSESVENSKEDSVLNDFEEFNSNKETETNDEPKDCEDFVDEEELKRINDNLTAEEKEERLIEANKFKKEGNDLFKSTKYLESITQYTNALRLYPLENSNERSIVYSNRAASKIYLGYKETALDDCTKSIELNPKYVRALLRRAKLYEELEKLDESLEDFKKILELDPNNGDAMIASQRLPPLIHERNEKLKTEMMGKLKDLGNMILKPFGLSTNNFNLQQDPSTGSYSVNFQQNTN